MRVLYRISTIPLSILVKLVVFFNLFGFKNALEKCISVVDERYSDIPENFVFYLAAAEDHRSLYHYGVDFIGVLRATFVLLSKGQVQGASTIEQQFVRVVTGDYSYSLRRKLREQLLAVALLEERRKVLIARAYLAIAYYGCGFEGADGVSGLIGRKLQSASEIQIISVIAMLKYPLPSSISKKWEAKHSCRVSYIQSRLKRFYGDLEQDLDCSVT